MSTITQTAGRPVKAEHRDGVFHVVLSDGKTLCFPASISPRLAAASEAQRQNVELLPFTMHWPEIDEDITVETLMELGHGN